MWKTLYSVKAGISRTQFVVTLVVHQIINQLFGHQNAKPSGAQTLASRTAT